jgi:hypothetical protein
MPPAPPSAGVLNPSEVQVGTANGPGIYLAPAGTEIPENTWDEWEDPWKVLGYLSDDGPTVGQSVDQTDITPWQSVVPIRSVITGRAVTLQFVLWQLNGDTIALYFDADPTAEDTDGLLTMKLRSDTPQHLYAVGIDSRDAERVLRIGFGRASLSDAGDMQITRGATVPLDVTLSALDDAGDLATILLGPPEDPSARRARTASGGSATKAA